jgi:hypothetical protein
MGSVKRHMRNLVVAMVAATLSALLVVGGALASWEVFLTYIEGRTYSGKSGLFLSRLPIMVTRFLLGCIAGGILAIITYRGRPLYWAFAMSAVATLVTLSFTTRIYVVPPGILSRIVYSADAYMFIPGAILGAFAVSRAIRLARGYVGRRQSSGSAKPPNLSGAAD